MGNSATTKKLSEVGQPSGRFTATNRDHACEVCGDTKGKCKSKHDNGRVFWLCVAEAGARKFDIINGLKCVGSSGDRWATFVKDSGEGEAQPTAEERQRQRQQREAEENRRFESGLSAKNRNAENARLLSLLSLHPSDEANLKSRGVSAETIAAFRSVAPWQVLSQPVNPKLSGIGSQGAKVATPYRGYLVPARNIEGETLGFQIRNRAKLKKEDPKYPWLSTHTNPANLQNGELPLAYVPGAKPSRIVYFAEGLLKPLVAAERLGVQFIGAAGGNFASSPQQLKNYLHQLKAGALILCADAGAVANPDVLRAYTKLNDEVTALGYSLQVLWWGQSAKGGRDIDELSPTEFAEARTLTWAEFAAKNVSQPIASGGEAKPTATPKQSNVISIVKKLNKKEQQRQNWLKDMAKLAGLSADIKPTREAINAALMAKQLLPAQHIEGTYQALTLAASGERRMYLLDGQKGTRKTSVAAKSLVNAAKAAALSSLTIVPSRLLSRDASVVLGAACHLDREADTADNVVTCPESLYKFVHKQWDVVVVDEVNEDIKRVFDGSLGVNPDQCQRALIAILRDASTIGIANDQMYRVSVAAAQRLAGIVPQETITVQRKRRASDMTINLYLDCVSGTAEESESEDEDLNSSNDAFYSWLADLVSAIESGKKVAIPCGSQTRARTIDRVLRAHFKGKLNNNSKFRGQVLDGKHTPSKIKSAFAHSPDQWLEIKQPNWLIWTPCFNSGVSIESDYFDAQFEALSVFEGANAASQRGERVRAVLGGGKIKHRNVFVSNRGLPSFPDCAIFTADYWRNLATATIEGKTEPSDRAFARSIGADDFLKGQQQDLTAKLEQKPELCEYWAIEARELYFKLETLLAEWRGNGWKIEAAKVSETDSKKWREAVNRAKQSLIESKSRALSKARAVAGEGQDLSPYAAVRAQKHHIGEQVGHDYEQLKNSTWLEAWVIAPDSSGGIQSQRIASLIKMSVEAPDLWATVCKLDTTRTIAAGMEFENLPALPIPSKEIAIAKILVGCPGVAEVLNGTLTQWNMWTPVTKSAATYLRQNAQRLATLSKHSQRIFGLQFKETTTVINCFHKALRMAGAATQSIGQIKKTWQYRLKIAADAEKVIEQKLAKDESPSPAEEREACRLHTLAQLGKRLDATLQNLISVAATKWQSTADQIALMGGKASSNLLPTQAPLTADESLLMTRLVWCQSAEEYRLIRHQLELHSKDYEGRYLSLLSEAQRQRLEQLTTPTAA